MTELPLEGVTVLDFSQELAGPFSTVLLADYGAEVIKVEPPWGGSTRELVQGALTPNVERNKRSITLDLKKDGSQQVIESLARNADAVLHNNLPGDMEKYGCDYDTLKQYNGELVFCTISGYGESGPYQGEAAFDPTAQAMSGLLWNTGEPDRKPSRIGASVIDMTTGMYAAFAITAAVLNDGNTGGKIEVSLFDVAASFMGYWYTQYDMHGTVPQRQGHAWDPYAPYGMFYADDGPVYLAIANNRQWTKLCEALGRNEWIDDPKFRTNDDRVDHRELLHGKLEVEISNYSQQTLVDQLQEIRIPISRVQTIPEAYEDEHLRHRNTVDSVTNVDGDEVVIATNPVKFIDEDQTAEPSPPPALGEDTDAVLSELGFSTEEIDELADVGVIGNR